MWPKSVLGALVLAILPLRATIADEPSGLTIDKEVPFTPEGRLDVDEDAGPVHVGQVVFQNLPTDSEIREASGPGDTSRPQPMLVVSNSGASAATLEVEVTLEDDEGQVLMSTDNHPYVKKDCINEVVKAYHRKPAMRTIDWPRLTVVHLKVTVVPR